MSDRDDQGTTQKIDVAEGGTSSPATGSPQDTGQQAPVMDSQKEESGRDDGDVHSRLSGSNPEAPGYGSPAEDQDA